MNGALPLFVKLMRASRAVFAATETSILTTGLTPVQFGVLEALWHKGPASPGALRCKVLTSSGNLTDVIDKLESRGLVQRAREPEDARRVCVTLTATGEALITGAFPSHAARIERVMGALDNTEQAQLACLLRKLGLAAAAAVPK